MYHEVITNVWIMVLAIGKTLLMTGIGPAIALSLIGWVLWPKVESWRKKPAIAKVLEMPRSEREAA